MADLGNKHECINCGIKFYDLGRSQLICPSCGGDQEELAKEPADEGQADAKPTAAKPKRGSKKTKKAKDEDAPAEEVEDTSETEQ